MVTPDENEPDLYVPTWAELLKLADRIEAGADTLIEEATPEVFATRAGSDRIAPEEWIAWHQRSAAAARSYAADLRKTVAASRDLRGMPGRPWAEDFARAETIAQAAELGGILIDGRPLAALKADSDDYFDRYERHLWETGKHPSQRKANLIESTGMFEHVAETIDGIEQVPFWRLVGRREAAR